MALNDDHEVIQSINTLKNDDFKILTDAVLVYLNNKNKLEKLNILNQTLVKYTNCKNISKWLIKAFLSGFKQDLDGTRLAKQYLGIGLDEAKAVILKELWDNHSKVNMVENQSLMISQLVDMEWKFGVTASTNEIDKFGNVFLQLKLVVNNGDNLETCFMELTLPQFYAFLHEMNKAKSQMDYLS